MWRLAGLVLVAGALAACGGDRSDLSSQLGGDLTRDDASKNAFGLAAPTLTNEERRLFEIGDSFFTKNWVTAPSSTKARDGLGPVLNAQACSSCHVLDGRGLTPDGDDGGLGLLVRLSIPGDAGGAPLAEPRYGGQLQDQSILGVPAEGRIEITYEPVRGAYDDGTPYVLRRPTYRISDLAFGPLVPGTMLGPRIAPQMVGMGLLEAVPTETILGLADPTDENDDGVSGRPNWIEDSRTGTRRLGRFGWKANVATVEEQTAGAFHGDIGITSPFHPEQDCTPVQRACRAAPQGGSPEIQDEVLDAVTFYASTLAVPALRDVNDPEVRKGARLFEELGCAACHTSTLVTGTSTIPSLVDQTIHPYTDLLLHDMGPGLADGRPDVRATGREWRTAPLWGIGLVDEVNRRRDLLHDGRARTIEEAILWHGGEAERSRKQFLASAEANRNSIIRFLESL